MADGTNGRICEYDANGKYLTQWGSQGSRDGQFVVPTDVVADAQGNVYVDDSLNGLEKFQFK